VRTTLAANSQAPRGVYVDQAITRVNVVQPPGTVAGQGYTPGVPELVRTSIRNNQGSTRRFYAADRKDEIANHETNPSAPPIPHSPNSWKIELDSLGIPRSRDYYRNNGMIGQDFFKNQG
jgi:hypothetical protein